MKKATLDRNYYHKKKEILLGTSIMVSGGCPADLAQRLPSGQVTNRIKYIEFVHEKKTPIADSVKKHFDKVDNAIRKVAEDNVHRNLLIYPKHNIKRTSRIVWREM